MSKPAKAQKTEKPIVPKEEKAQVRARRAVGHFEALRIDEYGRHRLISGTAEAARSYDLSKGGIVRVRNVDPLRARPVLRSTGSSRRAKRYWRNSRDLQRSTPA